VPLDDKEVEMLFKKMGADAPKHKIDLIVGDLIRVGDGPFKDFEGKVSEIDQERGKVKVLVSMFGRETPVELDFLQVSKV
ncbi:MAG: KOW motif-containing protein, partial [Patescibacteria group bacterium]